MSCEHYLNSIIKCSVQSIQSIIIWIVINRRGFAFVLLFPLPEIDQVLWRLALAAVTRPHVLHHGANFILFPLGSFSPFTLRKHAYSNILKILPPKKWNFSDKKFWYFFSILLKTKIVDTRRGGSNEYPRFIFWAEIKRKIMYIPVNPSFTM